MTCPACQTINPSGAQFCMNCGTALINRCPNCGTELPAAAQFCFNCGQRLASRPPGPAPSASEVSSPPTPLPQRTRELHQYIPPEFLMKLESARESGGMRGERRVVTMLFCDVQGSTAAAERLDPEEWAEIMNGAFEVLIEPVYRYEGTLARLMGDAILAFFGAPIAHEDDPQRAVLAGLDILEAIRPYCAQVLERWGIDFNVRIGVNTGLVVVGEVGSDLRIEYTAMGDAVNVAARMEQTAQPGTIQIAEDTYKAVAPLFDVEDLGEAEVRGKSRPVHAYRVLSTKALPGRLRGIQGLDSPMVGRAEEMMQLRGTITDLLQGRGQIVSVMGEAGLGKSRLVSELRSALWNEGIVQPNGDGALDWHEGRSFSYQTSSPYASFISLFNGFFGLMPSQDDEEKYRRIVGRIESVRPERSAHLAPFIASMLGVQLSGEALERIRYLEPPQLRERVFQAVVELVEHEASTKPLVLVFEDVHWIDPTSFALLEQLMAVTDRAPLLFMGVFRPWRHEPSWQFHEMAMREFAHRYTSISLQPLDQDTARELVANLLHVEDLPQTVRNLILLKAEGNPFFVEEVIRSLLDAELVQRRNGHWYATREIETISVPDTLAGVINARLDQLEDAAKRVIQTASVIGREFQFAALAGIAETPQDLDSALTELQRRELVRERSRFPQRVYVFKHALTQETAYESLLLSRRRELHRRLAEWLEGTAPERVSDIARHLLEARERERALPYLVEAADQAAHTYSTREAIALYEQALDIVATVANKELARRAYEGLGGVLAFANEVQRAVDTYRKMIEVAQGYGDIPMQVSAMNKLALLLGMRQGGFDEAAGLLENSEGLAREADDVAGLVEMHMIQCNFCTATADFERAVDHLSEAARIGRQLDLLEPKLYGMTHIASTLTLLTRFEEAWETATEAWRLAEEAGHRLWQSELLTFSLCFYHLRKGDFDTAHKTAEEGVQIAEQIGASSPAADGSYWLGMIAAQQGDYEKAIAYQDRALEAARAAGTPWTECMVLCALGTAYLNISPQFANRTVGFHQDAQRIMALPGGTVFAATAWMEMGFCAFVLGHPKEAEEHFKMGLTIPSAPIHLVRPQLLIGSALIALRDGDSEGAERLLVEARGYIEEREMRYVSPLVSLGEGQVKTAQGDVAGAVADFLQAEEMARQMQARPWVVDAQISAAQALMTLGRGEEAQEKARQARESIQEISALFRDAELQRLYLTSALERVPRDASVVFRKFL